MIFLRSSSPKAERPVVFDRTLVNRELVASYPREYQTSGIGGAVLRGLSWTDNAVLMQIAEDASYRTRFVAGAGGGIVVAWRRYPLVCYFAADSVVGQPDFDLQTGIINT